MENNIIFETVLKNRNGHYVHALEVENVYDIENAIESIHSEFEDCDLNTLKEFFNTMQIIYIGDDEQTENEVYSFDIDSYINLKF